MEKRRIISIIIAAVVAMLIMYAGKACTKNIQETNRKAALSSQGTNNVYTPSYQQNVTGQPVVTEGYSEMPSTSGAEVVTNILGDVVGTVAPTESTESGAFSEIVNQTEPTTRVTILDRGEQTTQSTTQQHSILGNSTNPATEPTTEKYVTPSSIVININ